MVNRPIPPRYAATLQKVRLYIATFTGYPSPTGGQVRILVFTDPGNGGRPPAQLPVLLDQVVTLPSIPTGGTWVDFPYSGLASLASGDLYVGYGLLTPAGGVGFAADTSSAPQRRAFYSTDHGITWQGPLALVDGQGNQTQANIMIRAVVAVPGP